MPISIDEFESAPRQALRPPTPRTANAERVLRYLAGHSDRAFTPAEIREATGVPRGSVCVVLARLEDGGQVRHRGAHWTAAARTVESVPPA